MDEEFRNESADSAINNQTSDNQCGNGGRHRKGGFAKSFFKYLFVSAFVIVLTVLVLYKTGYLNVVPKASNEMQDTVLNDAVADKTAQVLGVMEAYCYQDIDREALQEGVYKGMVDSLGDKYSQYFTADEFKSYMETTSGEYYGIGAVLTQDEDTNQVSIVQVYEGSPAAEAGLKADDEIVSAGGVLATSMELAEFVGNIKGDEGTKVTLTMKREDKEFEVEVERRSVHIPTVSSEMINEELGYIKIAEFGSDAVTRVQFEEALDELKGQDMKGLVIDLRDNPGGSLDTVENMLNDIFDDGVMVYTEDRDGNREYFNADSKKSIDVPIALLVNGNSASASEIFAGAMKDYTRATLIGEKTFGKGIVQIMVPLSDGSAVKVTTAKYFTPDGNYIHGVGIEPDVALELEYTGSADESYDMMKDNQVLKAIEVLEDQIK